LYWEFPGYGGQQAVRMGKWKGIRSNINKGNKKVQLFDLENDIQELNDVADKHPDIIKEIEWVMKNEHREPSESRFRINGL
jgi:arylsulfatase